MTFRPSVSAVRSLIGIMVVPQWSRRTAEPDVTTGK